jgi:hypothetical protein
MPRSRAWLSGSGTRLIDAGRLPGTPPVWLGSFRLLIVLLLQLVQLVLQLGKLSPFGLLGSTTNRSAVTNGTKLLVGIDGRSPMGRRYRDLIAAYTAEIGGSDLSQFEMAMIKQAAALGMQSEAMQAALVRGEPVNPDNLIRLSSEVRRILDALRERARDRKPPAVPNIHDYVAANYGAASEEEQ